MGCSCNRGTDEQPDLGRDAEGEEEEEVFLGLGSNLGDRMSYLAMGLRLLGEVLRIVDVSPVVASEAEGVPPAENHPDFLNAVIRGRTRLAPVELLEACHGMEERAGRVRGRSGAPRTLDIDLLFYGQRVMKTNVLEVPHPRWKERGFVLRPLLELAPEWRDPESGRTVEDLCRTAGDLLERARIRAPASAIEGNDTTVVEES